MTIHSADSPMEVDTHPKRRPVSRVNRQRRKRESTEKPTDLDFAQESAVNEVERILNQTRKILC